MSILPKTTSLYLEIWERETEAKGFNKDSEAETRKHMHQIIINGA